MVAGSTEPCLDYDNSFFQIVIGEYKRVPPEIRSEWMKHLSMDYQLFDEHRACEFLKSNFPKEYVEAFKPARRSKYRSLSRGKWKADLLRFCLMSKYSGIYSDVDLMPAEKFNSVPTDVDTIAVIGAHSPPTAGITPLPKGELAIGLLICRSPEPLFTDYVSKMTPGVVASGEPYAINIQGLYAFLCGRLGIDEIKPFTRYIDPVYKRTWYFLKECKIDNAYKMLNEVGDVVVHSQHFQHSTFY